LTSHAEELALVRALVENEHLSVPERQRLPRGLARLSLIVEAIRGIMNEKGAFPADVSLDDRFDGGLLVRDTDGTYAVHWRHEVAVMTYSTVRIDRFTDLDQAAIALARGSWRGSIDGVLIDEAG
jgi:hypothetical protein